jgi:hypothetical protein
MLCMFRADLCDYLIQHGPGAVFLNVFSQDRSAGAVTRWARAEETLRGRGLAWWLAALWVVIGAAGAAFAVITIAHTGYDEDLLIPPTTQWPAEPQLLIDVAAIAEVAWLLLSVPVLVAGFVRLRGWRPGKWFRMAAWVGSWAAGMALMNQTADWAAADMGATRGFLSVGELAVCLGWLVLGVAMTWILSGRPIRAAK